MTTVLARAALAYRPLSLAALIGFFAACSPGEEPRQQPAASSSAETTPAGDDNAIVLIVEGRYIVTMDANGTVVPDGAIAIDEGVILAVGPASDVNTRSRADERLDNGGHRVGLPGLI